MNIPVYYQYENVANSVIQPSTTHIRGTALHRYFSRYLLQDAMSVFKYKFPINWDRFENYVKYCLYCIGYFTVFETDKFGVIPQACGLGGYDVCYQPNRCVVSNPLINTTQELKIGQNCVLFQLQPDYGGIMDIVNFYADMLALTAESAGINLINTHVAYIFGAPNKAMAESYKKGYDQISQGDPAIVMDKNLFNEDGQLNMQIFNSNVKDVYIADSLLIDMQKWINLFRTEIGLPNANTEKKERMIVDEVNANNVATGSKVEMWLRELQKSCRRAENMFGIEISIDWRNNPIEGTGGAENEGSSFITRNV